MFHEWCCLQLGFYVLDSRFDIRSSMLSTLWSFFSFLMLIQHGGCTVFLWRRRCIVADLHFTTVDFVVDSSHYLSNVFEWCHSLVRIGRFQFLFFLFVVVSSMIHNFDCDCHSELCTIHNSLIPSTDQIGWNWLVTIHLISSKVSGNSTVNWTCSLFRGVACHRSNLVTLSLQLFDGDDLSS